MEIENEVKNTSRSRKLSAINIKGPLFICVHILQKECQVICIFCGGEKQHTGIPARAVG